MPPLNPSANDNLEDIKKGASELIGRMILGAVGTAVFMILSGFYIFLLWRWFVVPLGVMPIGIAHSIGIAMLARYLAIKFPSARDMEEQAAKGKEPFWKNLGYRVLGLTLLTFTAWIVSLFV